MIGVSVVDQAGVLAVSQDITSRVDSNVDQVVVSRNILLPYGWLL